MEIISMSFYRTLVVAVAAIGLTTTVFAANEATNNSMRNSSTHNPQSVQVADAQQSQSAPSSVVQETKVNINSGTLDELMKVKGLSKTKAKNIVTYRKKHGEFKSLDDLKLVKGFKKMNEENFKSIQGQLTIN